MRIPAMLLALLPAIALAIACADNAAQLAPEQVNEIVYRHIYAEATSGKLYSPCTGPIYASATNVGRGNWEVDIRCRKDPGAPLARIYGFNEKTGVVVLLTQGTPVASQTPTASAGTPGATP